MSDTHYPTYRKRMAPPGTIVRAVESEAHVAELVADEPSLVIDARRVIDSFLSKHDGTTLRGYRSDLAILAEHLGLVPAADERTAEQAAVNAGTAIAELLRVGCGPTNERVEGWKSAMKRAGLKPRTINRRLATVRSVLKVAQRIKVTDWGLDVDSLQVEIASDREGPDAERIARIVAALEADTRDEAVRDVAIIRLLRSGLRRGEVASRDLEHVKFDRGLIVIRGKKRTQDENVTLPADELVAIRRWLEVRGKEPGALFQRLHTGDRMTGMDVWRMTRARGREVLGEEEEKLTPVRPHGMRHNATVRGLDLTKGNTAAVSSMLRHRDIRIVQVYDDRRQDRGGEVATLLSEDLSRMVAKIREEKK